MRNKRKEIARDIDRGLLDEAFNKILLNQCEDKECCNGISINENCPIVQVLNMKGYIGGEDKLPTCIDFTTAMLLCKVEIENSSK